MMHIILILALSWGLVYSLDWHLISLLPVAFTLLIVLLVAALASERR